MHAKDSYPDFKLIFINSIDSNVGFHTPRCTPRETALEPGRRSQSEYLSDQYLGPEKAGSIRRRKLPAQEETIR